jgi:DNA-binding CsgD family transcriptional regulator
MSIVVMASSRVGIRPEQRGAPREVTGSGNSPILLPHLAHNAEVDVTASVGVSLTADELPTATERLGAELAAAETCDLHLALGLVRYLSGAIPEAEQHLRTAYLGFVAEGRVRRAALAAAHLGRLEYHAFVNPVVAAGWFGRGVQLLDGDEDCVERGWLALGMLGCSVSSADELHANAAHALRLARRHHDVDLECRALADYGLALVGQGDWAAGMAHVDQAMTMIHSGECTNLYVAGQVQCSFVSACERLGDVGRLEGWLAAAVRSMPAVLGPGAAPNLLLSHCRIEYGSLLCLSGRWTEAEHTLQEALTEAHALQQHQAVLARCALADLRLNQGRLDEAGALLDGLDGWDEARTALARLHLARGEHDLAVEACRLALLRFTGDQLRASGVRAVLVDAHLAQGDLAAARVAAEELVASAARAGRPRWRALAALARARVAVATGDEPGAVAVLERGLADLGSDRCLPLRGDLHLELARLYAVTNPVAAAGHARRALAIHEPIAAPQRFAAQRLLHQLGDLDCADDPLAALTAREREILRLVARGLSNPQIAERLVISRKTAEHHVGAILRKLGVGSRTEAAAYAATVGTPLG